MRLGGQRTYDTRPVVVVIVVVVVRAHTWMDEFGGWVDGWMEELPYPPVCIYM